MGLIGKKEGKGKKKPRNAESNAGFNMNRTYQAGMENIFIR
jgi:hypothetical protein